ncbi:YbjQ family protein [Planktomarina temperata]|nr:YbjQ family protein [Planktomarina temperata]
MAECKECGPDLSVFDDTIQGACYDCYYNVKAKESTNRKNVAPREVSSIKITTEAVPNLKIVKRIDVISAQAAFEINNFKDMFVGFMNPVKGRSNELEKQLDELKVKSTQKLKAKAHEVGANAVVAVDLDLSTVTIGSISMMMMMASGTAVVIEE